MNEEPTSDIGRPKQEYEPMFGWSEIASTYIPEGWAKYEPRHTKGYSPPTDFNSWNLYAGEENEGEDPDA